jgi:hypothetical protein
MQTFYTAYLPISTGTPVDRFGSPYNLSMVLIPHSTGELDEPAYHAYSPVYLASSFLITFTLAFALTTTAVVHAALYHGKEIWRAVRRKEVEAPDIHEKLMRSYQAVPLWSVPTPAVVSVVSLTILVVTLSLQVVWSCHRYRTGPRDSLDRGTLARHH